MSRSGRIFALCTALAVALTTQVGERASAQAPASVAASTIAGTIVERDGGLPVSGATIAVFAAGGGKIATATTDRSGQFTVPIPRPGLYYVQISATGFDTVRTEDIAVVPGSTSTIRSVDPTRDDIDGGLREIGRVSSNATGNGTLATSTTINQTVASSLVQKEGYIRIGDALGTLPGVNVNASSPSIGDDVSVSFRGYSDSETQTLLDGHPIGPQGASTGHYSFQVSPSYAIGNTVATYGSGALGLYGTDAIGGTVDQQTIVPTRGKHFEFTQGIGYEGRRFTDLQATGTVLDDKLGYAVVHAVDGSYGLFPYTESYPTGPLHEHELQQFFANEQRPHQKLLSRRARTTCCVTIS